MESVYDAFVGLPITVKVGLLGILIKAVTSFVKGNKKVTAWLESMNVEMAKAVKVVVVVIVATVVAGANCAFFGAETSELLGNIVAMASAAIAVHESWDKLILGWFKPRE